jgi:uncharacterized membrane protein
MSLVVSSPERAVGTSTRVRSIDIIRGVVMVLMAIDHVRVYSGVPAGGPTAGIFFTRWVTHFCAPAFVFLAGTGAFLHGRTIGDPPALARYLATRGLMLVVLELTVIRFSWTFNVGYSHFVLAGVIWMLGWCMVLLAGLILLSSSPRTIGIFGLLVIVFQQVFGLLPRALPEPTRHSVAWIWNFFYPSGAEGWPAISILYVLIPWIGVMAAGYGFGAIVIREPDERRPLCLRIGLSATALFLAVGGLVLVLQSGSNDPRPALFRLLDQRKYPASQLFLLMTLGPTIALLPFAERAHGWVADALATFGRVPLFYYLLHIPLIHVTALVVWYMRDGSIHAERFATAPFVSMPPGDRWSLPLLYLVWFVDVAMLYVACRRFADVKARARNGWLRYL